MSAPDARRREIAIAWGDKSDGHLIGRLTINGELWASVEWSSKYKRWCIEDAEGRCLTHLDNIHAAEPTKDAAVALAKAMIVDGRMPDPETAKSNSDLGIATPWAIERKAQAKREREQRAKRPATLKRKAEDQQRRELLSASFDAEFADEEAQPLFEALADAFDLTDPDIWKSNSFAMLRPRLALHVRAIVASLELELVDEIRRGATPPFSMWASKEQRKAALAYRKEKAAHNVPKIEAKLARAREILGCIERGERS